MKTSPPPTLTEETASEESLNLVSDHRPHTLKQYCDHSKNCFDDRLHPKVFLGYAVLPAKLDKTWI